MASQLHRALKERLTIHSWLHTLLQELNSSDGDDSSDDAPDHLLCRMMLFLPGKKHSKSISIQLMKSWRAVHSTVVGCQSGHAYINCDHYSLPTQIMLTVYPVWASLARTIWLLCLISCDERAFCLLESPFWNVAIVSKGYLWSTQCLKCMIHHSLIFCSDPTVTIADEVAEEDDIAIDVVII